LVFSYLSTNKNGESKAFITKAFRVYQ